MARYRRYTKTIVKAPRKKWNLGHLFFAPQPTAYSVANCDIATIVHNNVDNTNPTPTVIKSKRIRVYGCLTVQSRVEQQTDPQPVSWSSYVVYIPQIVYASIPNSSVNATYDFIRGMLDDHPEWVMSKKNLNVTWNGGTPQESQSYKWSQSTGKLKRNLKSGDKIVWILTTRPLATLTVRWQQVYAEFDYATCQS